MNLTCILPVRRGSVLLLRAPSSRSGLSGIDALFIFRIFQLVESLLAYLHFYVVILSASGSP